MFFPAFGSTRLTPEFLFQIEHNVAHLLVGCDRSYLATAITTDTLIESIAQELEFFGIYDRNNREEMRETIRHYLSAHKPELMHMAKSILADPENNMALEISLQPIRLPMMFGRRI